MCPWTEMMAICRGHIQMYNLARNIFNFDCQWGVPHSPIGSKSVALIRIMAWPWSVGFFIMEKLTGLFFKILTHWGRDKMEKLKFVPKGLIDNIPTLVQIMAWRRPGDKPLSEPMLVSLPTHICVTQPQWVNQWRQLLWSILILRGGRQRNGKVTHVKQWY